ncbi:MAG: polysaccharide biosynthesis/export family protein [Planctomycetes bacterium]|nr:polysaccharide biosynthesis/export family protein [Planctomycetota bacterium]
MRILRENTSKPPPSSPRAGRVGWAGLALAASAFFSGCAALTNPVADGVPVRELPPELLGPSKEGMVPLPLNALGQRRPDLYRLGPGDVLGVWIEGVLGEKGQPPPVNISATGTLAPSMGYPVPVRDDGTLPLPLVPLINVQGLSLKEVETAIRTAYTVTRRILLPGEDRIYVTLLRRREYHVLVIREESQGNLVTPQGLYGGVGTFATSPTTVSLGKLGMGYRLDLPAYENDVLNALTQTGGFPGLDAANEIVIFREGQGQGIDPSRAAAMCQGLAAGNQLPGAPGAGAPIIRIPLRLPPGAPLPIRPEDVILQSGDIVVIPARQGEFYYTAGILGTGIFPLPRDRDLNVLQAIIQVRGPLLSGGIGLNNLTGTLSSSGLGMASPSLLTVLRNTRGGRQVAIRVDLNRALRDRRERILVQPGDTLVLESTLGEAVGSYLSGIFHFSEVYTIERDDRSNATGSLSLP